MAPSRAPNRATATSRRAGVKRCARSIIFGVCPRVGDPAPVATASAPPSGQTRVLATRPPPILKPTAIPAQSIEKPSKAHQGELKLEGAEAPPQGVPLGLPWGLRLSRGRWPF